MPCRVATWATYWMAALRTESECFSYALRGELGMIDNNLLYLLCRAKPPRGLFFDHFSYTIRHWSDSPQDFLSFILSHASIYNFSFYHDNVHIWLLLAPASPPRSLMHKGCWLAFIVSKPDCSNYVLSNFPNKYILHPQMPLKISAGASCPH